MSSALFFPLASVCVSAMIIGWTGVIRLADLDEGPKALRRIWGPLWIRYVMSSGPPNVQKFGALHGVSLAGLLFFFWQQDR